MFNLKIFSRTGVSRGISLIIGVLVLSFAVNYFAFAWTEPNLAPPGCNPADPGCSAPVNVSGNTQYKSGALGIGGVFETDADTHLAVNGGNVGIGTMAPIQKFQIKGEGEPAILIESASDSYELNPLITGYRARGTTIGRQNVALDDTTLEFQASGWDGAGFNPSVRIQTNVDGVVAPGRVPGRIDFITRSNDGSLSRKMVIKADGNVGIGTKTPGDKLEISGDGEEFGVSIITASNDYKLNPLIQGYRSRGTVGSKWPVRADATGDDTVLEFQGLGWDGTGWSPAARIFFQTDGVVGAGKVPGRIDFATTVSTGGSPNTKMTIKSNGNVGIGTMAPDSPLHVKSADADLILEGTDAAIASNVHFKNIPALKGFGVGFYGPGYPTKPNTFFIRSEDNSTGIRTDRLAIDFNGNVGIGTATPSDSLHIRRPAAEIALDSTGVGLTDYSHIHFLNAGGQSYGLGAFSPNMADVNRREKFFISDNTGGNVLFAIDGKAGSPTFGNVGIGTTTPMTKLDVAGSGRFTGTATSVLTGSIDPIASTTVTGVGTLFTTQLVPGDTVTVSGQTRVVRSISSDTSLVVDRPFSDNANDISPDKLPAGFIAEIPSGNSKMALNEDGLYVKADNIVIDEGSPEINFIDSGTTDVGWRFGGGTGNYFSIDSVTNADKEVGAAPNWDMVFRYTPGGTPTTGSVNVGIGTGGSPSERLEVNGNVKAAAFLYSSDEKLKKNISKIENPLGKILKLDGVSYQWKDSGEAGIGLTAQNVETVFPELVRTDKASGMKSVEYGNLVAPLIEAIKEQQKMIENQQREIEALKVLIKQ